VEDRKIRLDDVEFVFPGHRPVEQAADRLLTDVLGHALDEALSWSYAGYEKRARDSLTAALNRQLGPAIRLGGEIDAVAPTRLDVRDDTVQVTVRVEGSARVILTDSVGSTRRTGRTDGRLWTCSPLPVSGTRTTMARPRDRRLNRRQTRVRDSYGIERVVPRPASVRS
jgi:hypothetical protein